MTTDIASAAAPTALAPAAETQVNIETIVAGDTVRYVWGRPDDGPHGTLKTEKVVQVEHDGAYVRLIFVSCCKVGLVGDTVTKVEIPATPPTTPAAPAATAVIPYVHTSTIAPDPRTLPGVRMDLHADSLFPRRFGKRVKALGGRWNACRGGDTTRFVHLPLNPTTRALIEDIVAATSPNVSTIKQAGRFMFVFTLPEAYGTGNARPWITVQMGKTFHDACRGFVTSYENAVSRGLAPTVAEFAIMQETARALVESKTVHFEEVLSIPGVEAVPHYDGVFALNLANGLRLQLGADKKGISIEGLTFGLAATGRRFTKAQVMEIAKTLGNVKL